MRPAAILTVFLLLLSTPAHAATIQGSIVDRTGAVLPGATVQLLSIATGQQVTLSADRNGRFEFPNLKLGIYRIAVSTAGFSESSRTVIIDDDAEAITIDFELQLGSFRADVTVSAARGERDVEVIPLRTDSVTAAEIRELAPVSTGDALVAAPGVTLVGSGPFQVRPRLRGLDSTRVLVLVDGERLNNTRTSSDRAGIEVGLVDTASVESIEVLGGAGSVLYGTDALSGTINIITNNPRFSEGRQMRAGFDGFYSSNEDGRKGAVTLGVSDRRWSISFVGGAERFDHYTAGKDFNETSVPFFTAGTIRQLDSVDNLFGFNFKKFPDPFNTPYTRTSALVPGSGMDGSSANVAGVAKVSDASTLEVKFQRRNATNVGFPDFAAPYFFQEISLPWSRLNKTSAIFTRTNIAPWFTRLSVTGYYQFQDRLLRNRFSVNAPIPSATFFPINVFRLDITSDTRQQVRTPGLDAQATFLVNPRNVLTVGTTVFQDRSEDERTATTTMSQIGVVAAVFGPPAATVFPSPVPAGPPSVEHPVRVPNASFRDIGVFAQDEWDLTPVVRLTAGLRVDGYRVATDVTPGYNVASIVAGATPAIDPATLPNVNGQRISRNAVTGELGATLWSTRPVSAFGHYVRSYRHPNLEELLFAGPATTGSIAPNVKVRPETGHNFDLGLRFRSARASGSFSYFNNTYRDFISTEVVGQVVTREGPTQLAQSINLAHVRIQGVEAEAETPFIAGRLSWLPYGTVSFNRGTVLDGTSPMTGVSLDGEPQDNITPWKTTAGLRVNDMRERWWASYGVRTQAKVSRVSPLLEKSAFLIAQDLFGLAGYSVHRLAVGYDWRGGSQRIGLTLAVDNLTDKYYREQFQFAAARGRSTTLTVTVRGTR